jgi:putative FmdB family regulatory protein
VPLYEYQCETCGRFEVIRKFSDEPLIACPTCGKPIQKLLSAPAIQFKGTGWYITDYARKNGTGAGKSDGAASSSSDSSSSEKKGDGAKSDSSTADSKSSSQTSTSKDSSASGSSSSSSKS